MITKKVNFNKVMSVEDMNYKIINPIKGLEALLNSLNLSEVANG